MLLEVAFLEVAFLEVAFLEVAFQQAHGPHRINTMSSHRIVDLCSMNHES